MFRRCRNIGKFITFKLSVRRGSIIRAELVNVMKKSIITLILLLSLCALLISLSVTESPTTAEVHSGKCGDSIEWLLGENNTLTLSGSGQTYDYCCNTSPWSIYADIVDDVVIEDGITCLGDYLFYDCNSIISIEIPESVISIGSYCFGNCLSLKEISVPDSVLQLGDGTFLGCKNLTKAQFGNGIRLIREFTFNNDSKLYEIAFSSSSLIINDCSFYNVGSLKKMTIPTDVTISGFFTKQSYSYPNYTTIRLNELTLYGHDVKDINNYYLEFNRMIFVDDTPSFADDCFVNRPYITEVSINGVTNSGINGSFIGCSNITSITNLKHNPGDSILYSDDGSTLIVCPATKSGVLKINDGVRSISDSAFCNSGLSSIDLNKVTDLGALCFSHTESLVEVAIPNGVGSLSDGCFTGSSIVKITLPESVTSIGCACFEKCTSLNEVIFCGYNGLSITDSSFFCGNKDNLIVVNVFSDYPDKFLDKYVNSYTKINYNDYSPRVVLSFDVNGGEGKQEQVRVVKDRDYLLPDSTTIVPPDGNNFLGWSLNKDGETIVKIMPSSDVTVFAIWTNKCILCLDSNNRLAIKEYIEVEYSKNYKLPETTSFNLTSPVDVTF